MEKIDCILYSWLKIILKQTLQLQRMTKDYVYRLSIYDIKILLTKKRRLN